MLKFDLEGENKSWQKSQDFPELASSEYSLVKVENSVFHFGGYDFQQFQYTNKFSKIDLISLNVIEIHDHLIFPKQRVLHSMVLINEKFYLFGGVHKSEVFNDLWTFDLLSSSWTELSVQGSIPTPRYLHAACANGNSFAIWGGEDAAGMKDDFFIFSSLTESWTEQVSGSTKPRPAKGACLATKEFKIYLYGGRTNSYVSNELWEYRLGDNSFQLLSDSGNHSVAFPQCWVDSQLFYVSLGTYINEGPSGIIKIFNFSSSLWSDFHSHEEKSADSSQSTQVFIDNKLVTIGGHLWGQETLKSISILGAGTQIKIFPMALEFAVVGSASVYHKKNLFVFGGGIQVGASFLPTVGHNLLFYISLQELCDSGDCQALCSAGTFFDDHECKSCPLGTFNDELGSSKCVKCKPGTFNQNKSASSSNQCIPCQEGSYNSEKGAKSCHECPKDKYCPVGSSSFVEKKKQRSKGSLQPPLYENPDLTQITFIYQILVSVPLIFVIFVLFAVKKLRIYARKLDLFDDKHNNPDNEYMIRKKTKIGACFTFLVVIGALLLTCTTVLEYFKANIQETKGLVTLVVLEPEAGGFQAEKLLVQVLLYSYGGLCGSDFKNLIKVVSENIEYSQQVINCERVEINSCRIRISFTKAFVNTGAYVTITITENPCYTSGIEVNLTSSSSIPNEVSSVFSLIHSSSNSVFIGSLPTEFYFLATPSLFKSESNRWETSATGYHISERSSPKSGSQFRAQDLASVSYLGLKIFIEKGSTGLLTQRKLKQSFLFFVGSLLGTVSGLFGIAGYLMAYFEALANKCEKKVSKDKVKKISAIETDLNFATVIKFDGNSKN